MSSYCYWFDGGTCLNNKAFPEGTPTEVTENCCKICKFKKEVSSDSK